MNHDSFIPSLGMPIQIIPVEVEGYIITYIRETSDEIAIHLKTEAGEKKIIELIGQPYTDNFITDYNEDGMSSLYKITGCREVRRKGYEFFEVICVYDLPESNDYKCKIEKLVNKDE